MRKTSAWQASDDPPSFDFRRDPPSPKAMAWQASDDPPSFDFRLRFLRRDLTA